VADFADALELTLQFEGGYVNDPDDEGQETYRGISRRFNPSWNGWAMIDRLKAEYGPQMEKQLPMQLDLQQQVAQFYKSMYWDRFWGDRIPDQSVADELFDTAVNLGVHRAVIFLQHSINLLNRNEKNYPDIGADGSFGPRTLAALESVLALDRGNSLYLLKLMNIMQGQHYIDYMEKNPVQEKFARGWLGRITI